MNEKALIKKCQRGDRQAFDELIWLYYDYVSGFLLKTTRDEMLSEDLTQETFLKMIRGIERFDVGGSAAFGTWLVTIAKNCYIDHLRRNWVPFEDIDALPLEDERNVADEVERKLRYEQLLAELETLPPEQALAIRLKYVEDMTLAQIAERFGVQPKTVKSRIHDGDEIQRHGKGHVELKLPLCRNSPKRCRPQRPPERRRSTCRSCQRQ